jgi:D-arabinose 1-dehydrogenase-like Zn-dependent alcohol dehydrogenase
VAIIPLITCQECDRCRAGRSVLCKQRMCIGADCEGCWADMVTVPVRNLVPIPDGLSDELAAVATDSVATAYHAVKTQGGVRAGSRVAVWGTGGLGLSAVGLSAWLGASSVIAVDPRPEAREWSMESGATEALHPDEALSRISELGGVDVALEFVGRSATVEGAVRSLDDGGRAVVVGVGFEPAAAGRLMTFVLRERELVGSYGAEPEEVREIVAAMGAGDLKLPRVVGDVIPLKDVLSGVERVHRGDTGGSRIVVDIAG